MKHISLYALLLCSICSGATIVGAGSGITATTQDNAGGDRLNVHQASVNLPAGTYNVSSWSLNVFTHTAGVGSAGTVTPMLLTGAPSSYTSLWLGSAFDPTANGVQSITTAGSFTLAAATDVYAGFFTSNQGAPIIGLQTSGGPTSHDSTFTAPTGVNQTVNNFSNPTLNRQYAFAITVVPEPSSYLLLSLSGLALLTRRHR